MFSYFNLYLPNEMKDVTGNSREALFEINVRLLKIIKESLKCFGVPL